MAIMKDLIGHGMGIDANSYQFKWKGKNLRGKESLTLNEVGIKHKDFIELTSRVNGGSLT